MATLLTTKAAIKKIDKAIADKPKTGGVKPIKLVKTKLSCSLPGRKALKISRNSSKNGVPASQNAKKRSSSAKNYHRINFIQRNIDAIKERKYKSDVAATQHRRRSVSDSDARQQPKIKKKFTKEFPRRPIFKRNLFGKRISENVTNPLEEEYSNKNIKFVFVNMGFKPNIKEYLCSASTIIRYKHRSDPSLVFSRRKIKLAAKLPAHNKSLLHLVRGTTSKHAVTQKISKKNDKIVNNNDDLKVFKSLRSIFHLHKSKEYTSSSEIFEIPKCNITPNTIERQAKATEVIAATTTALSTTNVTGVSLPPIQTTKLIKKQDSLKEQQKPDEKHLEKYKCNACKKLAKHFYL